MLSRLLLFILVFLISIPAYADRERLNRFAALTVTEVSAEVVTAGSALRIGTNNTPLQMLDESGNYHDVLSVNASGDTFVSAATGETVILGIGTTGYVRVFSDRIQPVADNAYNFGHSGARWKDAFIAGEVTISSVNTSGGVVCTKADGALGQCTSAVGSGGTCTCS